METILEWAEAGGVLEIPRQQFERELVRPLRQEGYRCPRRVQGQILGIAYREGEWVVLEVKTSPGEEVMVRVALSPDGGKFSPAGTFTVCSWRQVHVVLDFFRRNVGS